LMIRRIFWASLVHCRSSLPLRRCWPVCSASDAVNASRRSRARAGRPSIRASSALVRTMISRLR
jgi:hypothetical protein